jgi:hypothetical protein
MRRQYNFLKIIHIDYKMSTGELEADADSLSCRQSGLSSNDQMENDGLKLVLHSIHIHSFDSYNP